MCSKTLYLGQIISFKNRMLKEPNHRTAIAWRKFWSLKITLQNKTLSLKNKFKILKSCITPTLPYGS